MLRLKLSECIGCDWCLDKTDLHTGLVCRMDCATKDGLIIFLLIFSSVLAAIVIVLLIIFCRKRCCGGGAKRATPEEGGVSSAKTNHHENQVNISRVGQAYPDNDSVHEEHYVGEPV